MQRLAHAHHDDIIDSMFFAHSTNLIDNFAGCQVALQPEGSRKTKRALHGTADLGRHTQSTAPTDHRNQYRFHTFPIVKTKKEFARPIRTNLNRFLSKP